MDARTARFFRFLRIFTVLYSILMMYDPAADVTTIVHFNIWDRANLLTDQSALMMNAGRDARAAVVC